MGFGLFSIKISVMRWMELKRISATWSGMNFRRLVQFLRNFGIRLLSIFLCLVFLLFAIPSPLAHAVAGIDDLAFVLLASLAAYGISVTAAAGIEEVAPWVEEQFESFVSSAGDTLSNVWSKIRYGVTEAGKFVLNGFGLRYSARFGEWLLDKFSLSNDDSFTDGVVYPDGVVLLNDVQVYSLPAGTSTFYSYNYKTKSLSGQLSITLSHPSYVYQVPMNGAGYSDSIYTICAFYFISSYTSLPSATVRTTSYNTSGSETRTFSRTFSTVLDYYSYSTWCYSNTGYVKQFPVYATTNNYNDADFNRYNPNLVFGNSPIDLFVPSNSVVTLSTATLDVPQVGDYSDDDGIIIDGIGSWGDSLQDIWDWIADHSFPNSLDPTIDYTIQLADTLVDSLVSEGVLTTENSPYGLTPPGFVLPDLHFSSLWHYVTDWVTSMSSGLALIGGIMFSLPFVSAFYAVLVILIVLSVWRLLKHA